MKNSRRNRVVLASLAFLVVGMVGLSYASVPLYRLFCQVTGFGGTTQQAATAPGAAGGRVITVRFNSDVDPGLPWAFQPMQHAVRVRVGEDKLAFYQATNRSNEAIVGTAVYNVTPMKAGLYFNKVQCFCFNEQRLNPGESADMAVSFFIDPDILQDPNLDDIETITLSYTFFRAVSDRGDGGRAAKAQHANAVAGAGGGLRE
ncbi:MAG: cytochrome c oxidase assembly protein [Pseudomonadota bacterium]